MRASMSLAMPPEIAICAPQRFVGLSDDSRDLAPMRVAAGQKQAMVSDAGITSPPPASVRTRAVFGGFGDIAALQRELHGLKLTRVVERHGRRPAVVAIMKLNRDFRGVFALVDELGGFSIVSIYVVFRLSNSSSHNAGSGL